MAEKIILTPADFSSFVEQMGRAAPANARLEAALRDFAELKTEMPDGSVEVSWRPRPKQGSGFGTAVPPVLECPMAATPEAQAEQIIGLATWLNRGQRDHSLRWFDTPIPDLGTKSPRELVADGQAEIVRDYLVRASSGSVE
ncbi:antitoxin Xre/MbcA/ParS toxin-binding domain-containing protein [Thioalkalivibrio sp. XN279]|uniref:antitoxin Xre/MbcA/ParS toxin-binding domain-containing protein n=1 Tax=Thioalkalivibrio sp. XN279 TaxID=2714953 RepID=UPI00140D440B|nr:antitoxin Xre/MbcA/ParS toxin-binding domain-containing protein [Thioalkalivibrio sp. XN279]NHA14625.1 DUF2384 domain-containing protein [Thioalkalivibrio sp. XN279]